MAILKKLQVSVAVNDKDLPEYDDDEAEQLPNTVTKYVEAVSGATFQVHVSSEKKSARYGGTSLSFKVELDGEGISKQHLRGRKTKSEIKGIRKLIDGQWTLERSRFSDIDISMSYSRY